MATMRRGGHYRPLGDFLARLAEGVRRVYRGPLTFASLPWAQVDWNLFDVEGVDHYWSEQIRDRYVRRREPGAAPGTPALR